MCFSAQASFLAATGLLLLYSSTIRAAVSRADKFMATTQLLFALQQICEGFVWITLNHEDTTSFMHHLSVYGFLLFAFGLWPFWIPFVLWLGEPEGSKKRMQFFTLLGLAVSLSLFGITLFYGATASPYFRHIFYDIPAPWSLSFIGFLLFLICTLIPLFLSGVPGARFLAIAGTVGLVVSLTLYRLFFISVWCFFAAVCSGLISLLILRRARHER